MRRKPLRRKSAKADTKTLDKLARAVVFKRDGGHCVRCGSVSYSQWCHVYSRRYTVVRWDPDNSFVGCAGCHLWWHHQPMEAARWFAGTFPERAERLRLVMQTSRKPDRESIRLALQKELENGV